MTKKRHRKSIEHVPRSFLPLIFGLSLLWGKPLYTFVPVTVYPGIECVIGDLNPPAKANKGFVSKLCAVEQGDGAVILEAGPSYRFAREYAAFVRQRTGKKIKAVVITNYHDDRLYSAAYYRKMEIPLYAHRSIRDDIAKNPGKFERMKRLLSPEEFAGTEIVTPDRLFDRNLTIPGTRHTIELLKLSPVSEEASDIVVWIPDARFLFAGNIVFNGRALNYTPNSDMQGWIDALKKIEARNPAVVLGGHGAAMGPDAFRTTLEYLQALKRQVEAAYAKEIDSAELMKHIDLSRFNELKHAEPLNRSNARHYYEQLEWR